MDQNIKQRIESIISNIDQLPPLPEVASKVINMVSDPDVSFKLVAQEISKNQAMTANILKLCNSAFFSKGKEITSIDRAIVTLGLKEVKDIVLLVAAKPVLDKPVSGYDLAQGDLWKQGLAVATMSRDIAIAKKRKDLSDIVFTGGIIHNVGKVVIALFVQQAFRQILELVQTGNIAFHVAEKEIMGYNHQEVGEKILIKWNFPPVLRSIVRFYQDPSASPPEHMLEVSIVHIANAICLMGGVGIGSDGLYHEIKDEAIKKTGLTQAELEELYTRVPDILKQIRDLQ
ncbi:MAG TPA: HDOD domain-containing protein [Spirochaetota bacterium]|nr:HDOD domain-containing protein [Spirochaetota bacterium]HPL16880.1 HDOD domain-containing protein [Spirochaetota bacterium]HQF06730.1 HDOD domain-containing protein [Spirochaetota bacterium]HQH95651.1 HDOD domain-containing protein [Spirochaetota bacterium]HQJ69229.1 HDOD domain-containing protein [Spirochaetota bacterium]